MKSLLILISIIALVFSTPVEETNDIKDYIEIVKCFLEQQPLIDDVNSIVEMIKTQDFSQAITLLFKAYGDVQAAISKCMPSDLSSINTMSSKHSCVSACNRNKAKQIIKGEFDEKEYNECIEYCKKQLMNFNHC